MRVSFLENPYRTSKAFVYPITNDLSFACMNYVSRHTSNLNYVAEGFNGQVFKLGKNLVVKKSKSN